MRAEDKEHRPVVQCEDARWGLIANLFKEKSHFREIFSKSLLHVSLNKIDPVSGKGQRDCALVEQANMASIYIRRLQEGIAVIRLIVLIVPHGNPTQGVNSDTDFVF